MSEPRTAIAQMPAQDANAPSYTSLSRVQARLTAILSRALDRAFWLRAELASVDERNGALYAELVETDGRSGKVLAKMRCNIWSTDLSRIRRRFETAGIELSLQPGNVVGLQCVVSFHPVYGLSLRGLDMDPAFVLGELELRRRRILANLEREGLLAINATRRLPLLPNRILLITSSSGAAFHDFVEALSGRCGVQILLADSIMQGPKTEEAVLRALGLVERLKVDLVVLIRGGGSKLDLGSLDSEAVARRIAGLSVPVWTGIGHETDSSVLDAVSAQAFRTPTAVAEALAQRFERVAARLAEAEGRLRAAVDSARSVQRQRLERAELSLRGGTRKLLDLRRAQLTREVHRTRLGVDRRVGEARAACAAHGHKLVRSSQLRMAAERGAVELRTAQLRRGVPQRLAAARIQLAPHAGRIRASCDARLAAAETRVLAMSGQLHRCAARALQLRADAMLAARARLSQPRVQAQLHWRQTQLAERARALRAAVTALLGTTRARLEVQPPRLHRVLDVRARPAVARLELARMRLVSSAGGQLRQRAEALLQVRARLSPQRVRDRCEREREALAAGQRILRAHDPRRALERGFSLTYAQSGKLVRSVKDVSAGETITTHLSDGEVAATVVKSQEEPDDNGQ